VYAFLAVGLVAASQSGNIVRIGDAHPVAITAFRLLIASVLLAPLAARSLHLLGRLQGREVLCLLAAGTALALHLFAWVAAVQRTTVANAATFFSVNPLITAAAGYIFFREKVSRALALSILLGVSGVVTTGLADLSFRPAHLVGDGLALLCSLLFTAYFLFGKRVRRVLPTGVHVVAVYATAAAVSFACLLALGLPFAGYSPRTWLCFGLMALVPTVIGHTAFNNALGHVSAGWLATATLSEPLLAGIVAYLAWGETVSAAQVAGYALICLSVVVLAFASPAAAAPTPRPSEPS
jgi:drug/metabolite transporter (DMT)-like permease